LDLKYKSPWGKPVEIGVPPVQAEGEPMKIFRIMAQYRIAVAAAVGVVVLFYAFGAFYYYHFPAYFERPAPERQKPGVFLTGTIIRIAEDMTAHWLPNDVLWPTVLLDNPQSFQLGELETVRYAVKSLRDDLSRLRTTDQIDPDVDRAAAYFFFEPTRWAFPSAENRYRLAIEALERYRRRLEMDQAGFSPRADNLHKFIGDLASLLGGVSNRLANAPRDIRTRITEETAGDVVLEREQEIKHLTPWRQIDNNFYYARGVLYVMRQLMLAVKEDFSDVISQWNAGNLVTAITRTLDRTQFEPLLVANGDRGSLWANHSLQLQALLEDARQKMRSLQNILAGG
jgi:hypothetical protein